MGGSGKEEISPRKRNRVLQPAMKHSIVVSLFVSELTVVPENGNEWLDKYLSDWSVWKKHKKRVKAAQRKLIQKMPTSLGLPRPRPRPSQISSSRSSWSSSFKFCRWSIWSIDSLAAAMKQSYKVALTSMTPINIVIIIITIVVIIVIIITITCHHHCHHHPRHHLSICYCIFLPV